MSLSTREVALGAWLVVFAVWVVFQPKLRESAWHVVRAALVPKLAWMWLALALSTLLLVQLLEQLGVWTMAGTGATGVWFAFTAIAYPIQFGDASRHRQLLPTLFRDSITALVLVELLVDSYTFPLPVELVLVPAFTFVAIMGALAEIRHEHRQVARLFNGVQATFASAIIFFAFKSAIADRGNALSGSLYDAALPVILTFGTIPYILLVRFYVAFDGLVWRFGREPHVSRSFQRYAGWRTLWHLGFRPAQISGFLRRNGLQLHTITDRRKLDALLQRDGGQQAAARQSYEG